LSNNDLETISVSTIRTLCMDAIQAANSGHPGTLLAYDTQRTVTAAKVPHARAERRNLFIEIPGTPEGPPAIEEAIASGVPVNVTPLFSADHYRAAADANLRGVERRVQAGHDPAVGSVASVFISRWDVAVKDTAPVGLTDTLTVGLDVYRAYREVMGSRRFQRLENAGTRMQRLLWAGTRTRDPAASDTLYVHGLAAPFTVDTMPDGDGGGCGAAPGDGGQPLDERAAGRGAHPVPARLAGRALRARRVHAGARSGGSTPSTSGASSSARCLLSRSSRSSRARATPNSDTTRPRTR
jgi:transaldolase